MFIDVPHAHSRHFLFIFSRWKNVEVFPFFLTVDFLLNKTSVKVVVYNGQLDLICDSIGVEAWVQTLAWPGLPSFNGATRNELVLPDVGDVVGYVKNYKRFYFYWMLRAGHMLPADQGDAALFMLADIIDNKEQLGFLPR